MGYPKIGVAIAGLLTSPILLITFLIVFEDELFFKSDAKEFLSYHEIELVEDFEIISNKVSGFNDIYHKFELRISQNDKKVLIKKITKAKNYQDTVNKHINIKEDKPRYSNEEIFYTLNYYKDGLYIYEYYKPNKQGIMRIWDKISISSKESKLIFEAL